MTTPENNLSREQAQATLEFADFNIRLAEKFGAVNEPQTPEQIRDVARYFVQSAMHNVKENPFYEIDIMTSPVMDSSLLPEGVEVINQRDPQRRVLDPIVNTRSFREIVSDINEQENPEKEIRLRVTKKNNLKEKEVIPVVDETKVSDLMDELAATVLKKGMSDDRILSTIIRLERLGLSEDDMNVLVDKVAGMQTLISEAELDIDEANTDLEDKLTDHRNSGGELDDFFWTTDSKGKRVPTQDFKDYDKILISIFNQTANDSKAGHPLIKEMLLDSARKKANEVKSLVYSKEPEPKIAPKLEENNIDNINMYQAELLDNAWLATTGSEPKVSQVVEKVNRILDNSEQPEQRKDNAQLPLPLSVSKELPAPVEENHEELRKQAILENANVILTKIEEAYPDKREYPNRFNHLLRMLTKYVKDTKADPELQGMPIEDTDGYKSYISVAGQLAKSQYGDDTERVKKELQRATRRVSRVEKIENKGGRLHRRLVNGLRGLRSSSQNGKES